MNLYVLIVAFPSSLTSTPRLEKKCNKWDNKICQNKKPIPRLPFALVNFTFFFCIHLSSSHRRKKNNNNENENGLTTLAKKKIMLELWFSLFLLYLDFSSHKTFVGYSFCILVFIKTNWEIVKKEKYVIESRGWRG